MIYIKYFTTDIIEHTQYIDTMYDLLAHNMAVAVPDGWDWSSQEHYEMWYRYNIKEMSQRPTWKTVIAFDEEKLCGYCQYGYAENINAILLGEIQIDDSHKGDHETFKALIRSVVNDDLYSTSKAIHLHINKLNKKSQSVFTGMGFKVIKMTERGARYSCDVESIRFIT